MSRCFTLLSLMALASAGCASAPKRLADVFPPASVATPWQLDGAVWSGTLEQAASALGDDADAWAECGARRVWLAVYRHEREPDRTLTVRAFAFDSVEAARQAYQRFRPGRAAAFRAGDEGSWTGIGVLFVSGCLVFEIFGQEESWQNELHAAALAGHIVSRLPEELASSPR